MVWVVFSLPSYIKELAEILGNNGAGVSQNIFCIILVPFKEKEEELHRKIIWEIPHAVACWW